MYDIPILVPTLKPQSSKTSAQRAYPLNKKGKKLFQPKGNKKGWKNSKKQKETRDSILLEAW